MKYINCIGDSHSSMLSGQNIIVPTEIWFTNGEFKIFHVGAVTAFNCKEKGFILDVCNSVPKDEFVLLSFGEIDMRCRVGLADDKFENIELIIKNYFEFIDNIENKNIIILGVTPCIIERPFEDWYDEDFTREFMFTATRGTLSQRNSYKNYFNNRVNEICKEKGYIFIDFWNDVFDKKELYKDDIHLNGELSADIICNLIKSKK